ncbi:MerR family transcriptional regulator [Lacticaseibacillus brantae]|uniref:HTH merR-type domain-containing protein n=1 Tax=Lacticaseibacillus brantae DSM 23927 TaxID=1423727 RepID=A0A0R2AXN2_9LACO|nr:MerR family transcriptional regulator [Lacticaseibacillus brantae]KRM72093.1 hypothetical protein FC34_GL001077 [Lacticaseibacillus brantae DSM 23927]
MNITELAAKLDVAPSKLRYYEQIGLISASRQTNGNRNYDRQQSEQARRIILFRRAGVSIAELKQLFADNMDDDTALKMLAEAKERISAQMQQLDETMAFLEYKTQWHRAQRQKAVSPN